MRIIAGTARGRVIASLPGLSTRPTRDRVREALFSILQRDVPGARVLDLFSGSGALGLEALSRGAKSAVFVDIDPSAIAVIRENIATLGVQDRALVLSGNAFTVHLDGPFDLIFLDPPYALSIAPLLERLPLAEDGLVIYEHASDEKIAFLGWQMVKERVYGVSTLSLLQRGENA